jgi:HSP20 family protein
MVKRHTITMASIAIIFMGALALFADNSNTEPNQVQIQSSSPSQNFGNMQSSDIFKDQLKQMQQMQNRMQQSMKSTFNDPFFKNPAFNSSNMSIPRVAHGNYPQIKYFEKNNAYIAQFVVPGISKKDIKIELKNHILNVSGKGEEASQAKDKSSSSSYSYTNEFSQSIRVPNDVDAAKISSDYKDGILTITMPKNESKDVESQIIPIN